LHRGALAYDPGDDVLFVASTADNTIFAVPQAGSRSGPSGRGAIIFQDDHLRGPLALVFAPNGNLLTANGDAVNAFRAAIRAIAIGPSWLRCWL
jgi:hypothetical protein